MFPQQSPTITNLLEGLQEYMVAERRLAPKTIKGYKEAVLYFSKSTGPIPVTEISLKHFIAFKARQVQRGVGESRIANVINAMKCLFKYANEVHGLSVIDLTKVKSPRVPRREVLYLIPDELQRFIDAITLHDWKRTPRLSGYCLRALVGVLTTTGMRISEALALNRVSVDWEHNEALIIGKGNKQRTVFFTTRAIEWLSEYIKLRTDENPALFISRTMNRLTINAVEALFRRVRGRAGLEKPVTPHILRHTTATNLLRNGCPIGFIKEILGHESLGTTCRYYLGILNKQETKKAHERYSEQIGDNSTPRDYVATSSP